MALVSELRMDPPRSAWIPSDSQAGSPCLALLELSGRKSAGERQ